MSFESGDKEEINAIFMAFKEIYAEKKSYDQIHINDLSERSGIPIGKIYANFTDKDDIAIGLIKKAVYEMFITFDEETDPDMPLSDKLKVFVSLQLEFLGPDFHLLKELLPGALLPFSTLAGFLSQTRSRYLDFISELFLNNIHKADLIFRTITLPALANSFLLFNLSVLQFWEKDKSEGRQSTLNFIEKGVKNFMIMSALL
jgi:AcrR family transcriptional regulator